MYEFKDKSGRAWPVVVNGYTIKRVLDLLKVDLGDLSAGDPPLLTRIDTDIAFLVDLIYVVCKPDADDRDVSDVAFAAVLEGDVLHDAHEALMEELVLFFQSLRRPHIVRLIEKQREIVNRAVKLAEETVTSDGFNAAIDRRMEALGKSFASLPESLDASPDPGRSGN